MNNQGETISEEYIDQIDHKAEELHNLLSMFNDREMLLAKERLEECMMWAIKSILKP